MKKQISGWGKNISSNVNISFPKNLNQLKKKIKKNCIARGMGRSYGDSSFQRKNTIVLTNLNKIIEFDKKKGVIELEAGISIKEILQNIIPHGWFLPVTPGSKYITIGGMIASDVHGKNHHKIGSFRHQIIEFKIIDKKKNLISCSKKKNINLFNYTIGGMGLTGIIYSCKFKLLKISSHKIYQEKFRCKNIYETIKNFKGSAAWPYNVAWLDTSAKGKSLGRSILFRAKHLKDKKTNKIKTNFLDNKVITLNNYFPNWLMNSFTINILNKLYYNFSFNKNNLTNINNFFYQLDKIKNWNLIYGKKGFISYQFVLPLKNSTKAIIDILNILNKNKVYSFVSVIKSLGKNDGYLSFGIKGLTLVFDFPNNSNTYSVLNKIDQVIIKNKGNIYLCKDSRISHSNFFKMKSNFYNKEFTKIRKGIKNKFYSEQSLRLNI